MKVTNKQKNNVGDKVVNSKDINLYYHYRLFLHAKYSKMIRVTTLNQWVVSQLRQIRRAHSHKKLHNKHMQSCMPSNKYELCGIRWVQRSCLVQSSIAIVHTKL